MESDFTSLVWIELLEASRITSGKQSCGGRLVETNERFPVSNRIRAFKFHKHVVSIY